MAAVCVAIFVWVKKGRVKNISFPVRFRALRYSKPLKSAKSMRNQSQTRLRLRQCL